MAVASVFQSTGGFGKCALSGHFLDNGAGGCYELLVGHVSEAGQRSNVWTHTYLLVGSWFRDTPAGTAPAVFSAAEMINSAAKKLAGKAETTVSASETSISVVETIVSTTDSPALYM